MMLSRRPARIGEGNARLFWRVEDSSTSSNTRNRGYRDEDAGLNEYLVSSLSMIVMQDRFSRA